MTRIGGLFILALTCPSTALAQSAPQVGRPVDYSNIEGKYTLKVSAEPTSVHVEEPITLRIEITGTGPKDLEPSRKKLKLFPQSFGKDFYVEDPRTEDRIDRDKNTWLFVYRIKLKHAKVEAIPELKLVFFDPATKRFGTKYADAIPLKVTPKPELIGPDVPLTGIPSAFFERADAKEVLRDTPGLSLTDFQIGLLIGLPPLLCVAGAWGWRRWFPDEWLQARRFRLAAPARVLAALQANPPAAFCRYLQERLDFPVEDPTPVEVYAFLKRRGVELGLCSQCQAFFQACDAQRFTKFTPDDPQFAEKAARLIRALEEDLCVRA